MRAPRRTAGEWMRRLTLADAANAPSPLTFVGPPQPRLSMPSQRARRAALLDSLIEEPDNGGGPR